MTYLFGNNIHMLVHIKLYNLTICRKTYKNQVVVDVIK